MAVPEKISSAAQRLKEGHRINRITVRDFLRHFGAERRGAAKVQAIRSILDSLDLQTDPDFATAWMKVMSQLCTTSSNSSGRSTGLIARMVPSASLTSTGGKSITFGFQ